MNKFDEILFSPSLFFDTQRIQYELRNQLISTEGLSKRIEESHSAWRSFCANQSTEVYLLRVVFNFIYGEFRLLYQMNETTTNPGSEFTELHLFDFDEDGNCFISEESSDGRLNFYPEIDNYILNTDEFLLF